MPAGRATALLVIATDYIVRATTVWVDLCVGVAVDSSARTVESFAPRGCRSTPPEAARL